MVDLADEMGKAGKSSSVACTGQEIFRLPQRLNISQQYVSRNVQRSSHPSIVLKFLCGRGESLYHQSLQVGTVRLS